MHDSNHEKVPPVHLRRRVHGADDLDSFLQVGETVAADVKRYAAAAAVDGGSARVLDFGCGCCRVLRFVAPEQPAWDIRASDLDGEAISWCRQNLAHLATFSTNAPSPPLPFSDELFDFVYSISIFTHLPEDLQWAWLEELRRVTRPGGYLLLSTHGEGLFPLPRRGQRAIRKSGFYYCSFANTEGLPDFYQTSVHTHRYIEREWSRYFDVVRIDRKAVAGAQDAVLCRRRSK